MMVEWQELGKRLIITSLARISIPLTAVEQNHLESSFVQQVILFIHVILVLYEYSTQSYELFILLYIGGWSLVGITETEPWTLNSTSFQNEKLYGSDAFFRYGFEIDPYNSSIYNLVVSV